MLGRREEGAIGLAMLLKENIDPSHPADLKVHTDVKCYQCALCDRVFTRSSDLKKHKFFHADTEKLIFYQVSPSKVQFDKVAIKKQEGTEPTGNNEPTLPSDTFATPSTEKSGEQHCLTPRHEEIDIDDTDADDIENIKITGSEVKHLLIHNNAKQFSCSLCNTSFTEEGAGKRHMLIHTGDLEIYSQRGHSDAVRFPCSLCRKSFSQASDLKKHMLINHSLFDIQMADQLKPVRVLLRDFLHDSLPNIQGGVKVAETAVGQASISSEAETRDKALNWFGCSICRASFAKNYDLKTHFRTHTKEKLFACKLCSKPFAVKSNLYRHMRVHSGEKPYPCPFCSRRCSQSNDLRKHICIHTGEKPFRCSQCSKSFVNKMALIVHMKVHTKHRAQEAKTDIIESHKGARTFCGSMKYLAPEMVKK